MLKEVESRYSKHLQKNAEIVYYGHYGFALLVLPTISDSLNEFEKNGLIESITPFIKKGKCRVFAINGSNYEGWLSPEKAPEEKSKLHFDFNKYLIDEVIPYIYEKCRGPIPIILAGAGLGAYHAANNYFRRPDIFYGVIAMSGFFNIDFLAKGYFDDNCYFNSPVHYLPNLTDSYWLSFLTSKHHVYLLSGSGENEHPQNTLHLSEILNNKGIKHFVDIWGEEWGHNYDTWNVMLPHILENKL